MIPKSELIESAHAWYDVPISTAQDRLLCALVTLRMIGSEVFDLLNPHRSSFRSTLLDRTDGLMNILLNDIQKWQNRWSSMPEMGKSLQCTWEGHTGRLQFSSRGQLVPILCCFLRDESSLDVLTLPPARHFDVRTA